MFRLMMRFVNWGPAGTAQAPTGPTFAESWAFPIFVRPVMVRPIQVTGDLVESGHKVQTS